MAETVKFSGKTPGEIANQANMKSDINLGIDKENYPSAVVRHLREDDDLNVSLSNELAMHRHLLGTIMERLEIEDAEFTEYFQKAESAKTRAREEETENPDEQIEE